MHRSVYGGANKSSTCLLRQATATLCGGVALLLLLLLLLLSKVAASCLLAALINAHTLRPVPSAPPRLAPPRPCSPRHALAATCARTHTQYLSIGCTRPGEIRAALLPTACTNHHVCHTTSGNCMHKSSYVSHHIRQRRHTLPHTTCTMVEGTCSTMALKKPA